MTVEDEPKWRPLFVRDTPAAAEYEGLVEGIPEHLERSLWRWAMDRAARDTGLQLRAERLFRVKFPTVNTGRNAFDAYWYIAEENEQLALIDFFCRDLQEAFEAGRNRGMARGDLATAYLAPFVGLDRILAEGGSVWTTTAEPFWGLTRRHNETTQALVDLASSPATDAARKVASAWSACYRHAPDYDSAYRYAVLAVEAVALPVVLPNNDRGTLGTVVAHLRDAHDKWRVGGLDDDRQASGETLYSMLATLWHNQERHARADGTIHDVKRSEAEAAVPLAVTLVHWFASGLVERRGA